MKMPRIFENFQRIREANRMSVTKSTGHKKSLRFTKDKYSSYESIIFRCTIEKSQKRYFLKSGAIKTGVGAKDPVIKEKITLLELFSDGH